MAASAQLRQLKVTLLMMGCAGLCLFGCSRSASTGIQQVRAAGIPAAETTNAAVKRSLRPPTEITTHEGKTYKTYRRVKVLAVQPDGITISYEPQAGGVGIATVKFQTLTRRLQRQYGYDARKSADFELAQARAMAEMRSRKPGDITATLAGLAGPGESKIIHFDRTLPRVNDRSVELKYDFDLSQEAFEVFVPQNYSGDEPFGLCAFINSENEMTVPKQWISVLEQKKLIGLIPQQIGNDQSGARRMGLTLVGILKMTEKYRIDTRRIFTGGFSGGARCSLHLALLHSDVISGNISICGADFYQPVPKVKALSSGDYGVWPTAAERVARARAKSRFVFITGDHDFRYGNIFDIYTGGFAANGFQAKLMDVPGMGHELCSAQAMNDGISFLESRN